MGACWPSDPPEKNMEIVTYPKNVEIAVNPDNPNAAVQDVKEIMKRIMFMQYNARLYDKRSLQAKRSAALKSGISKEYVELLQETKTLHDECFKEVRDKVLRELKITLDTFETGKKSADLSAIRSEIKSALYDAIRANKQKLGVSDAMAKEISSKYQAVYTKCDYMSGAKPDLAREASKLFGEDSYVGYVEIMVADSLFDDYRLLPLEIEAFVEGD